MIVKATLQKAWAFCFRSATVVVSYALMAGGQALMNLDAIAIAINDPMVTQQVHEMLGGDPVFLGWWARTVGIVVTGARLRSILLGRR